MFRSGECMFRSGECTFRSVEYTYRTAEYKPIAMFIHINDRLCLYIVIVINKRFKYRKMTVFESLSWFTLQARWTCPYDSFLGTQRHRDTEGIFISFMKRQRILKLRGSVAIIFAWWFCDGAVLHKVKTLLQWGAARGRSWLDEKGI